MSQQREVELKAILLDQHANTTTPASFIIMAGVPMWQQQKRGGKCCGCCCDYRRAVIVLAIIRIAFIVLINMLSLASNGPDDWSFACVIMIVGILLNLCPLVGALTYNICLVAVDFVWCAVTFILVASLQRGVAIIQWEYEDNQFEYDDEFMGASDIINDVFRVYTVILAIFWVLYLFPHIGFIVEVCNGTMSRETYPREEYSCCCSTTRSRRHTFVDELPEVPYIT